MPEGRGFSIVCLSPQQWWSDLPTNRQQIMLRAAQRGHRVLFVETSSFLGRHLWHLIRKGPRASLARRLFGVEEVGVGVRVRKALNLLPWGHKHRLPAVVNRLLTAGMLRLAARNLPRPMVLWVYDPCAAIPAGSFGAAFAVYDCVDDYAEQAGPDARRRALVAAADELATARSRLVFVTSRSLHERKRGLNPAIHLVPNVGDYGHFAPAADRSFAAPETAALPRPVLGFSGNFLPSKVDFGLLEELAVARPDWTLLLIGPSQPGSHSELDRLAELENVAWLGSKRYEELPRYVAAFDVGLIPYVANTYTQSCFPLKVYEYLAAGKPVVASGLPELAGMEPDVVLADGASRYLAAVEGALARTGNEHRARRMALAAQNTWETRAGRLLDLIADELAAQA